VLDAPLDVILAPHQVLQPDVVLVHRSRQHILTRRGIEGPPDLVVEILSPFTALKDRGRKRSIYAEYGVPEFWIVDSANVLLEQYVLVEGKYELQAVFHDQDVVHSTRIRCVQFTMADVMRNMPEFRD
jgi:Uma2 family endonuclease